MPRLRDYCEFYVPRSCYRNGKHLAIRYDIASLNKEHNPQQFVMRKSYNTP